MVFQSQLLHKPERSGHRAECTVVYFYESTNIRGRTLIKNFVDFPIPAPDENCDCLRVSPPGSTGLPEAIVSPPERSTLPTLPEPMQLSALEKRAFQHIEGPPDQLKWLAGIALNSRRSTFKPPLSSKPFVRNLIPASVTKKLPKLAPQTTSRVAGSSSTSPADVTQRVKEGSNKISFWRYRDSSTLHPGMAESIDKVNAPMKRQRRLITIPATSGPTYYHVWKATNNVRWPPHCQS
ncbi:hypothetical protein FRC12_007012 [Ceratobasidium sp. 428]|nr:hypothetical protein FRC09_007468 [Ceratobasidium sp. 395]KAG8766229.1 hypothetical protein FRC12_007012 [Ceratobasidium sp. 428]